MTGQRLWRVALALVVVGIATCVTYLFRDELLARLHPGAVLGGTGTALVGGPFALVDQDGAARTDADFRGKFMLVYFGYTYCPDVCPTTLAIMVDALDKLRANSSPIQPIFVTVDPERDTPDVLKRYVANFSPRLIGLTGSPAQVAAAARAYRVYYAKAEVGKGTDYLMDHSGFVYLMGPDGKYIAILTPQMTAEQMAERLAKYLSE